MRLLREIKEYPFETGMCIILAIMAILYVLAMLQENTELNSAAKEMSKKWGVSEDTARTLIKNNSPKSHVIPIPVVIH